VGGCPALRPGAGLSLCATRAAAFAATHADSMADVEARDEWMMLVGCCGKVKASYD